MACTFVPMEGKAYVFLDATEEDTQLAPPEFENPASHLPEGSYHPEGCPCQILPNLKVSEIH